MRLGRRYSRYALLAGLQALGQGAYTLEVDVSARTDHGCFEQATGHELKGAALADAMSSADGDKRAIGRLGNGNHALLRGFRRGIGGFGTDFRAISGKKPGEQFCNYSPTGFPLPREEGFSAGLPVFRFAAIFASTVRLANRSPALMRSLPWYPSRLAASR